MPCLVCVYFFALFYERAKMKRIKLKINILYVLIMLMLFSIPITAKAFSIQSYISSASERPYITGYSSVVNNVSNLYHFDNVAPNNSMYVIYRNAVIENEKKYDLVIYPFKGTSDAVICINPSDNIPILHSAGSGYGCYKLLVTEHMDSGIGNAVEWTGMIGFSDLDQTEYCILPEKIDMGIKTSHIGVNVSEEPMDFGYKYTGNTTSGPDEAYDYNCVYTRITIGKDGYICGHGHSNAGWGALLAFDSLKQYIESNPKTCDVTYIDVVGSQDGEELSRTTKTVDYLKDIRGFDVGSDISDNAYYNGYRLVYDTSAEASEDGICIYRIFERCVFDIPVKVIWQDKNNILSARTYEISLSLFNGNTCQNTYVIREPSGSKNDSGEWSCVFKNVPKYSTDTGEEIKYSIIEGTSSDHGFISGYIPSMRKEVKYNIIEYSGNNTMLVVKNKAENADMAETDYGVTISGNTTWNDENNKYLFRPKNVVVSVYDQNGRKAAEEILEGNDSSFHFTGLPYFDEDTFELYEYTVKENSIDNYEIKYDIKTIQRNETDKSGRKVVWKEYNAEIYNTFMPSDSDIPARFSENTMVLYADYFVNDGGNASEEDLDRIKVDRDGQVINVTLKQLKQHWKAENQDKGAYREEYAGYSGNNIKLCLKGSNKTILRNIPYGKYEICVDKGTNFEIKNMEEISSDNVLFLYEDGKYYVVFSYQHENMNEEVKINLLVNSLRRYNSKSSIFNFFAKILR